MKVAIILLLLSIFLTDCETKGDRNQKKNNSKFNQLFTLYFVGDIYAYKNICPPAQIFDPGTYDFSLEKGEALYFDISPRLKPELDNWSYGYFIGISKEVSSNIAMNALYTCNVNQNISNPRPVKTASDSSDSIDTTDNDFSYYRYSIYRTQEIILTAKAIKSTIKFKLKIPQKAGI